MNRGDVVLVDFGFVDVKGSKVRPALVVSSAHLARTGNAIVATITRSVSRTTEPTHLFVDIQTPKGARSGLMSSSMLVGHNLFTVSQRRIHRVIGHFPASLMRR